jgi:hypothetical protein
VIRDEKLWFWSERRWRLGQIDRYLQLAKAIEEAGRSSGSR